MRPAAPRRRFGRLQLVLAPLRRRKSRASLSVAALALAAGMVTALLTLYTGVEANLSHEFRRYGANLVVTPAQPGALLDPAAADAALARMAPAAGVLYASAQTVAAAGVQPVMLAGADLARLTALNPTWRIQGAVPGPGEAWIGLNAARHLHLATGAAVALDYGGRSARWRIVGTLQSGDGEDNLIVANLADLESLTGLAGYTTLGLRVGGGEAGMRAAVAEAGRLLPGAIASPVRQLAAGEGRVLLGTRAMLAASIALMLLTIGLCLAAALMTLALERRRDFGLMKALGGDDRTVMAAFVAEAALLGLLSSALGLLLGGLAAAAMGHSLFGLWLLPGLGVSAWAVGLTVALAAVSAWLPWPMIRSISPAAILRGE